MVAFCSRYWAGKLREETKYAMSQTVEYMHSYAFFPAESDKPRGHFVYCTFIQLIWIF